MLRRGAVAAISVARTGIRRCRARAARGVQPYDDPMLTPLTYNAPRLMGDITVRFNDFGPARQRDVSIRFGEPDAQGRQVVERAYVRVHSDRTNPVATMLSLDDQAVRDGVSRLLASIDAVATIDPIHRDNWVAGRLGADPAEDIKDRAWKIERNERDADASWADSMQWWGGRLGSNVPEPVRDVLDAARAVYAASNAG